MKKTKVISSLLFSISFILVGCGRGLKDLSSQKSSDVSINESEQYRIYKLALQAGATNLSYEEWLESIKGEKGPQGIGILSIKKTSTDGLIDTYTITFSDGTTSTFTIKNGEKGDKGETGEKGDPGEMGPTGNGIKTIQKTSTDGLVDTYTITFTDDSIFCFEVKNGQNGSDGNTATVVVGETGNWVINGVDSGISAIGDKGEQGVQGEKGEDGVSVLSIEKTATEGLVDTYTILFSNETTQNFFVTNGAKGEKGDTGETGNGIKSIEKIVSEGLIDTYKITYTDETYFTFTINNGEQGIQGEVGATGNGISSIKKTSTEDLIDTYTIEYTDGSVTTYTVLNGAKGDTGETGKSAYEIYLEYHPEYEKNEEEWLDDLVNGRLGTEEETKYKVTFVCNNGEEDKIIDVVENKKASKPSDPEKAGYTFEGWYTSDDEKWVFSGYSITENITLYAKYSANEYKITYKNGDESSEVKVKYNEIITLPVVEKANYTLLGWVDENNVIIDNNFEYNFTKNIELTAKWVKSISSISFDSNGGSECENMNILYGSDYSLPIPRRDGFLFLGWFEDEILFENNTLLTSDINLIASWKGVNDLFEFETTDCGIKLTKYTGDAQHVIVPKQINDLDVVDIDVNTFKNNDIIKSIEFNGEFSNFKNTMFGGCTSLEKITISSTYDKDLYWLFGSSIDDVPETLKEIEWAKNSLYQDTTMFKNSKLANQKITLILPDDMTSIYESMFSGCIYLESIILPSSILKIDDLAFSNCQSLSSITLSDSLTYIGYLAFSSCISLTSFDMPNNVTQIGSHAFAYCHSLENIVLSENLTSISWECFRECSKLKRIDIPENIKNIGINLITSNENIYEENGIIYFDNILLKAKSTSLSNVKIKNGTKYIAERAFADCTNLRIVEIPSSVVCISDYAFSNCVNLNSIILHEGLKSIGGYCFENASLVTSLIIPDSVNYIAMNALAGMSSLELLKIPFVGVDKENIDDPGLFYTLFCSSYYSDTVPKLLKRVDITNTKIICENAFAFWSSLETINLPEELTTIGGSAFCGCSSLESINLPNGLTTIGSDAFGGCSSLKTINLPNGLITIGDSAFGVCSSLKTINLPEELTTIGDSAFYACSSLETINLPNGLTTIGDSAFSACSSLKTINLPEELTTIGDKAFYGCSSLEEIELPSYLTDIGEYAFAHCESLTSVIIPDSVTVIKEYAFAYCYNLKTFVLSKNLNSLGKNLLEMCQSVESLIIPKTIEEFSYIGYTGKYYNIFFEGTADEFNQITGGDSFKYMNYVCFYSDEPKVFDGYYYYWHYVNNAPTHWKIE